MSFNLAFADSAVATLRTISTPADLKILMAALAREMGCRYFALIHHDDLRSTRQGLVNIKDYPAAVTDRLIENSGYRRDPIIRGCLYSGGAFLWSGLHKIITLDRRDRAAFELGALDGLNEGVTIPYVRLGDCMGSCTFAGMSRPEQGERILGAAQMIGIFAFQAALRALGGGQSQLPSSPRLHPRPRDCVVLAGRGYTNKEIARALALTPRTVDGYLTEARRLFGANDRTELVVSAVLAGEVGLHELRRQPE